MLYLLWWQRRLRGAPFEILPVHIADTGRDLAEFDPLIRWAETLGLRLITVHTDLRPHSAAGLSPCFSCAWNRKKALFETAERLGSSVVALGHHSDDVVTTALMNLFFQGRFDGILPRLSYFGGTFRLIRPLYFVSEHALMKLAREEALPLIPTTCEFADRSKRALARSWLDMIMRDQPSAKRSLLGALHRQALATCAENGTR